MLSHSHVGSVAQVAGSTFWSQVVRQVVPSHEHKARLSHSVIVERNVQLRVHPSLAKSYVHALSLVHFTALAPYLTSQRMSQVWVKVLYKHVPGRSEQPVRPRSEHVVLHCPNDTS